MEDHDDTRELLAAYLEMQGYAVTACENTADALEQLRARRFDVVVTDYWLTDDDASRMLALARDGGLLRNVGVLVFTAHPAPSGVEGYAVVRKPFRPDAFMAALETVLTKSRASGSSDTAA